MANKKIYELEELTTPVSDDLLLINQSSTSKDKKVKMSNLVSNDTIESAVSDWLDDHPEATTTVEDDSLTTVKYKNKSVTLPKLGDDVNAIFDAMRVRESLTEGAITTFSDGAKDVPMDSLVIGIEPKQDLHGYDHPWSAGEGKNKIPITCDTQTKQGVTYTVYKNEDGAVTKIHAQGTATADHSFSVVEGYSASNSFMIKAGSYWFKGISNIERDRFDFNLRKRGEQSDIVQITDKVSLELSEDTYFQSCYLYVYNGTTINTDIYPMIWLKSSPNDDFEPYSNICSISGWDEANVSVVGKNLFDKATIQIGYVNDTTGEVREGAGAKCTDFIRVLPNTSYYIKSEQTSGMRGAYYDENKNYISGVTAYANSVITTPSNAKYVRLTVLYNNNGNIDTFGINCPSTDTEYHAYNGQTYTIQFRDGDNPLTVYGGTLDVVSEELVVDRVMVDLGTLNWSMSSSTAHGFYARPLSNYGIGKDVVILCSHYPFTGTRISGYYEENKLTCYLRLDVTMPSEFYILDTAYSDATAFKTAMNGVQLVYELATPITYQLTPTQVKSLLGTNNVWADCGDIKSGIYTANIKLYIDKKLEN